MNIAVFGSRYGLTVFFINRHTDCHFLSFLNQDLIGRLQLKLRNNFVNPQVSFSGKQNGAVGRFDTGTVDNADHNRIFETDTVLFADLGRRTTDVEGSHRQLGTRLTD